MKTFLLCMLFFVNSSIAGLKDQLYAGENVWPVSRLKVDVRESQLSWHVSKLTGTHTGTLKVFLGELTVHGKKLTGGYILLDMNSLQVTDLTQPDKQKLETNLKGDNFFDTGRFSVARFDISEVNYSTGPDSSQVSIAGNLTLHGIVKPIVFKAGILKNTGSELIARADVDINRRDWAIATANFKYDRFISPMITLHILLRASSGVS